MNHSNQNIWKTEACAVDFEGIPDAIPDDSTICIAKPAPLTEYAIPLRITDRYTADNDCRVIVTSLVSAEETIQQQQSLTHSAVSRIGVVDTRADGYLESLYQENPTISLPQPGELSQLAIAARDLHEALSTSCSKPHVILRSLTPILDAEPLERVTNVLERLIRQQSSSSSLTVFSIDYTEHDEATMAALEALADGIVWVEQTGERPLRFDYRRVRPRKQ
ncbi:hypothetical protein HT576_21300 [Haloterrigena sp. SYSU A121-1]|uniref:KaiC/GvpD/RAD55 family RecA-like ATPase n=1 Tax=Haloterrigena gelatinilytica TaxID=2741724 RepID=A0A8J8GU70_9EURY|nr:hypothetical protein [Haloterrigena gelatinilytica]NUB93530.1 hypothetical protein [Haloterrigena gelatinilytica]